MYSNNLYIYQVMDQEQINQYDFKQLEHELSELCDIFRATQQLVYNQQESIDRIDENIQHANINTELAVKELVQAKEYKKSYYKKILMLLGLPVSFIFIPKITVGSLALFTGYKYYS